VTRPTPALVDAATWEAAQSALLRNQRLSKKNSKNVYLLRGLVRCAGCGHSYVGGTGNSGGRVYRCASHMHRSRHDRCDAKILPADWLEEAVWEECRQFIRNPGDALDDARRRLRERMTESTHFDADKRRTLSALAEKEAERERMLTLFRRGAATLEETEAQLDAVAREAGQLREELESLRSRTAVLDIEEAQLTEGTALLETLRDEVDAIDASNDQTRKRQVIEAYVRQLTVESQRVGPRRLTADVRVALRFRPEPIAVESVTPWPGAWRWRRSASIFPSGAFTAASA
jgi:site-specific DNA recombinase